jgi:hypothetical protein
MKLTGRSAMVVVLLTGIGSLQMVGDLAQVPVLKGFGTAFAASPAPKVFTAHKGFETYSARFLLHWTDKQGARHSLELTPEVYRGVAGPYNRRNAYGAALSYAPVLNSDERTRPMLDAAIQHVFCGRSTLLEEIGVDRASAQGHFEFELQPRQKLSPDHPWKLRYEINCHD